jgi:hypothetical protein
VINGETPVHFKSPGTTSEGETGSRPKSFFPFFFPNKTDSPAEYMASSDPQQKKKGGINAIQQGIEKAALQGMNTQTDFTIHISDTGEVQKTVDRACKGWVTLFYGYT